MGAFELARMNISDAMDETDREFNITTPRTERGILTVGKLRELMAHLPADAHVVIDDQNGWYLNVEAVGIPNEECDPWSCLTLFAGDVFDARQM